MKFEVDEQTLMATLIFATMGWALYENPQWQEPAVWIAGTIVVGWAAVSILLMLSFVTELMLWDYLRDRVRGRENGG